MRLGVRVEGPLGVSCRVLLGWGWKLWQQSVKGSVNSARHWAKGYRETSLITAWLYACLLTLIIIITIIMIMHVGSH